MAQRHRAKKVKQKDARLLGTTGRNLELRSTVW